MEKEKSVFHYLHDSLEFNFGIFSGMWEGTWVYDFQNSNGD